jgi:putative PIN family toxin of toxin-antitoxin system
LKVVFDTNIYVSALMLPGSRADLALSRIVEGTDALVISKAIVDELLTVLARKFSRDADELSRIAVFLHDLAELVRPDRRLKILPDGADNRVLECASAGKADAIVTGDKTMLDLKTFEGIRVMSLRQYLERD